MTAPYMGAAAGARLVSQPPCVLADNVFDVIQLYAGGTLTASSEAVGRTAKKVIGWRRDRQWWEPTTDGPAEGNWIAVNLGTGVTAGVNSLYIDRNHTLHGRTVVIEGGNDGTTYPVSRTFTVPATTAQPGGDPTSDVLATTEEGSHFAFFGDLAPRQYWRFRIPKVAAYVPRVTNLMLGMRSQLLGYSSTYDEDAGERTEVSAVSDAGYRATGNTYTWRTMDLTLALIGAAEYDATIRALRARLFALNQPCAAWFDWGTRPERGWVYQLDGRAWSFGYQKAYRGGRLRLRELEPVMR